MRNGGGVAAWPAGWREWGHSKAIRLWRIGSHGADWRDGRSAAGWHTGGLAAGRHAIADRGYPRHTSAGWRTGRSAAGRHARSRRVYWLHTGAVGGPADQRRADLSIADRHTAASPASRWFTSGTAARCRWRRPHYCRPFCLWPRCRACPAGSGSVLLTEPH